MRTGPAVPDQSKMVSPDVLIVTIFSPLTCLPIQVYYLMGIKYSIYMQSAPLTSTWPHLRCDVGLDEGEY